MNVPAAELSLAELIGEIAEQNAALRQARCRGDYPLTESELIQRVIEVADSYGQFCTFESTNRVLAKLDVARHRKLLVRKKWIESTQTSVCNLIEELMNNLAGETAETRLSHSYEDGGYELTLGKWGPAFRKRLDGRVKPFLKTLMVAYVPFAELDVEPFPRLAFATADSALDQWRTTPPNGAKASDRLDRAVAKLKAGLEPQSNEVRLQQLELEVDIRATSCRYDPGDRCDPATGKGPAQVRVAGGAPELR